MKNLVPEKRVDKNGRLVTKHVRSNTEKLSGRGMPAPAVKPANTNDKRKAPLRKQQEQWLHTMPVGSVTPDSQLMHALEKFNRVKEFRLFVNDVEAYSILAMLKPSDATAVLNARITTPESVTMFLKENNLEHLIVDNSTQAQEAFNRRIPATSYITVMAKYNKYSNRQNSDLMDAAEVHGTRLLREYGFHTDVVRGQLSLQDIKTIGITNISKYEYPHDIRELLWEVRDGTAPYTAEQLKTMIHRANKYGSDIRNDASIATEFGADFLLSLHDTDHAYSCSKFVHNTMGHLNREERIEYGRSFLKYNDDVIEARRDRLGKVHNKQSMPPLSQQESKERFDAGLTIEEVMAGLEQRISVQQMIGIRDGIAPSVSDGWI